MPFEEGMKFGHARDEYVSDYGIIGYRGSNRPQDCIWWNHMPASLIKKYLDNDIWQSYFKFCVIRNPFDKVISAFYFFQRSKSKLDETNDLDRDRTEFEDWLLHKPKLPIDRHAYIIDKQFCLDDVLRYETLEDDLQKLCDRLEITWNPEWLPTLKAGFRPGNATVKALYNNKTRKVIERKFSFELDYFGYSFPE